MIEDLQKKKKRIAVLGLGYVGLPLALEFAKKYSVIGFDINESRIALMRQKIDPSQELDKEAFDDCDIEFTTHKEDLKRAHFFIVTV
ncbi:MAG: nucleotide sugar dehydrogenase, partial [Bacteroidales bacterium]|nr:nucleotide sugar dehydrogenase [Bacteroidales bacterium]